MKRKSTLIAWFSLVALGLACTSPKTSDGGTETDDGGDGGESDGGDGGELDGGIVQILSITPTTGEAGESFIITGIGFQSGAIAFFGTNEATDSAVSPDGTTVSGTVPANMSGSATVTVSVTNFDDAGATSSGSLLNGFTYASDAITWCKLYPPTTVVTVVGTPTPTLTAEVLPAVVATTGTDGGTGGAGIPAGEVGFGDPGADPVTWTWNAAIVSTTTDGANGVYNGFLTPEVTGTYAFAFRFSLGVGSLTYVYCDTLGTNDDPNGQFQVASAGQLTVVPAPTVTGVSETRGNPNDMITITGTNLVAGMQVEFGSNTATVDSVSSAGSFAVVTVPTGSGTVTVTVTVGTTTVTAGMFTYESLPSWCQIEAPTSATVGVGTASPTLNAQVYAANVTPSSTGAGVAGQIGVETAGSDPASWTWTDATFSSMTGNNDVFSGTVMPSAAGDYVFAFRFSIDTVDYLYCDTTGPQSITTIMNPGTLSVVTPLAISAIQPTTGVPGDTVTIMGTGFSGSTTFNFGSTAAMVVSVSTDGTTATVIAPGGSGMVMVTASSESMTATASSQFTYDSSVDWCQLEMPTSVTVIAGQTTPALTGETYESGVTPNSGTGITGQIGFGAPTDPPDQWTWAPAMFSSNDGNNDVYTGTLTPTMDGTYAFAFRFTVDNTDYVYCDSFGLTHGFDIADTGTLTVTQAPTMTNVSPTAGMAGGSVTITGTNLSSSDVFNFGMNAATIVSVSSDGTTATVTVPSGNGGVQVSVNINGFTTAWSGGQFTYEIVASWCQLEAPTMASVVAGQTSPSLSAQVYQSGVTPNAGTGITGQIGFGSATATPDQWTWSSASFSSNAGNNDVFAGTITPTTAGSYDYLFRFTLDGLTYVYCNSAGPQQDTTPTSAGTLTVLAAPSITGVSPATATAGSIVTITGSGFTSSTVFAFGSNQATVVQLNQAGTSATVTVPTGSGMVSVSATLMGDTTTWSGMFDYSTAATGPSITGTSPSFVSVLGGQLTINGAGFDPTTASVTIGGQTATIQGTPTETQIVVIAPAMSAPGIQQIVVTSMSMMSTPFAIPYALKFTITPDGNLSDWPAAALVGSETAPSEWTSADELTSLYLGYDDTNVYIGIQGQVEAANAIIGYLSIGDLTWGSGNIAGTLTEHSPSTDALGDELSSGFNVAVPGFLAQYGYGLFGTAPTLMNSIGSGTGVRRFMNPANYDWVTSTVAQATNTPATGSPFNGIEIAIPWQTTGTGADLFVPFPTGSSDPLTISTFIRIVSCDGSCFPNQSLPSDPNLQTGNSATTRATVSSVASIQVY